MKGATECAKKLKQLIRSLRASQGKAGRPATGDPVTQLILGIFSRNAPETKAQEALEALRAAVVDYNDLRVIDFLEMADLIGPYPDARRKCEDLSRALNSIFAIEHTVSLERLASMPKRDALVYLNGIDGLEAYTRARIRLQGFQQHAIPLDEAMWELVRREGAVDPKCTLDEAQSFLERQIPEKEALEFVGMLKKHAWSEMGAAVRKGDVQRILSVPPDRTSRNMLQMVASGAAVDTSAELDLPDDLDDESPDAAPRPAAKRKPKAASKARPPRKEKPASADGPASKAAAPARKRSAPKSKSA